MPQDITFTTATPFIMTVSGELNSAGEVVCDLRPSALISEGGALLATDNLSDLDNPATALTNLGATETGAALVTVDDAAAARSVLNVSAVYPMVVYLPDIISASAVVVSVVAPFDCAIVGGDLWASSTIAAGDLTATLAINGVAVTNGVMTLASGATSGTIGACTPTALNEAVGRQGVIRVMVGGGNTAAGRGTVTILVTPALIA
jgi:hypothetical protein